MPKARQNWTQRLSILAALGGFATAALLSVKALPDATREAAARPVAQQEELEAPNREATWAERYQAALASKAAEDARIQAAQAAFEHDKQSPLAQHSYVVSFATPVNALDVLNRAAEANLQWTEIFTWIEDAPGSIHVGTGRHTPDMVGYTPDSQGATRAFDALLDFYQARLAANLANLQRSFSFHQDAEGEGAANAQHAAVSAEHQQVQGRLLNLYGIACLCSPNDLEGLASSIPDLALRVVEQGVEAPIWPRDAVRDLVIASNGSYGR